MSMSNTASESAAPFTTASSFRKQSESNLQGFGIVRDTAETTSLTHRPSRRRSTATAEATATVAKDELQHYVRKQVAAPQPHQTMSRRRSFSAHSGVNNAATSDFAAVGVRSSGSSALGDSSTTTPPRRSTSSASRKPLAVNTAERIFPSEGAAFGESETPRRPTTATPRPASATTPSQKFARWAVGSGEDGAAAPPTPRTGLRCHPHPNQKAAEYQLKDVIGERQKAAHIPGESDGPFPAEATGSGVGGMHIRPMLRQKDMCKATGPENGIQQVRRQQRRCADQHYHNTLHFLDSCPRTN